MGTSGSTDVTIRHLTDDDLVDAGQVFVGSLGGPLLAGEKAEKQAERYRRYWDVEQSLGAFDGHGKLLGVAATWPAEFTVEGGAAVSCAAVPSVGVRPDSHRRGVGRALLEQQVREATDRGAAVMALNASETGIYGRYGYGPTSPWWAVRTDPRMLRWREDAPVAAPGSITELDDIETARELLPPFHRRAFGRWAGELSRPDNWWWVRTRSRDDEPAPRVAVHRDEDGEVDGSIMFSVKEGFDDVGFANEVSIGDCVATTPRVLAVLWRWILERRLVGKVRSERTDPRLPLEWMLVEPRAMVTEYRADAAWVRILDLPHVLGARPAGGSGEVRIRVVDRLVEVNDGTWLLRGDEGRPLEVERTDAEPDVTLSVDLLAPLAWGYARATTLAAAGRIDVGDEAGVRTLDRLLATAGPSWCSTGF